MSTAVILFIWPLPPYSAERTTECGLQFKCVLTDNNPPSPGKVDYILHHRGLHTLLFSNSGVGPFMSHKNKSVKVLWDRTYGFSSLFEKTRKSKGLQMSSQRQHFLLSYFKTLTLLFRLGFELTTSHSADRRSPNWANQAAVIINECSIKNLK